MSAPDLAAIRAALEAERASWFKFCRYIIRLPEPTLDSGLEPLARAERVARARAAALDALLVEPAGGAVDDAAILSLAKFAAMVVLDKHNGRDGFGSADAEDMDMMAEEAGMRDSSDPDGLDISLDVLRAIARLTGGEA